MGLKLYISITNRIAINTIAAAKKNIGIIPNLQYR
jgi:hypothetical protein